MSVSILTVRSSDAVQYRDADGCFKTNITITLQKGNDTRVPFAVEAQIKESDGDFWRQTPLYPAGVTTITLLDVEVAITYNVRVRYLYTDGTNSAWSASWSDTGPGGTAVNTHTVVGNTRVPKDIQTFDIKQIGSGPVEFAWTPGSIPPDLAGYEIRYGPTQDWANGTLINRVVGFQYESSSIPPGTYWFGIATAIHAWDISAPKFYNYSENVVWQQFTVTIAGSLPGCFLGGSVSSFTWNTTDSKLVNYTESSQWNWEDQSDIDPVAGEITVPESGYYKLTAVVLGNQGNTNKEEWGEIRLDIQGGSNPGRLTIAMVDIPTDKTSLRNMVSVATRYLEKDQVLSLYMWASTGLGTFNMDRCTFEIKAESIE